MRLAIALGGRNRGLTCAEPLRRRRARAGPGPRRIIPSRGRRSRAAARTRSPWRSRPPALPRAARPSTSRSSPARITAAPAPASTPSSRCGVARVVTAMEDPDRGWWAVAMPAARGRDRGHAGVAAAGPGATSRGTSSRVTQGRPGSPEARPYRRRFRGGRAARTPADHRGGGERAGAPDARHADAILVGSRPCSPTIPAHVRLPGLTRARRSASSSTRRCARRWTARLARRRATVPTLVIAAACGVDASADTDAGLPVPRSCT